MKKKIAIVYDFFSEYGGIERVMISQAKILKKCGYDVYFAFAYVDEKLKKERLRGFKVIEYSKFLIKNEALQICLSVLKNNIINKFKDFRLLICHSFPASYLACRIKKKFNIPYILFMHHPPQFLYNADLSWAKNSFKRKFAFTIGNIFRKPLRKFDGHCVKNASTYLVASKTVQGIIKGVYGVMGEVIYPPFDKRFKIKKHDLKDLSKYGIKENYVLGSGRIIKHKRFDYLIRAFSKLSYKNIKIVLAGKYEEKEKKRLEDLAVKNKVKLVFLGPLEIDELKKLYNLAKVVVLTCPKEWFGLVPVEAMACGCPVIAWKDNFGPEETIIENKNGFLVEPYNIKKMADSINHAINKKWNKEEIRKTAERFSEKRMEKKILRHTKNLLSD